MDNPPYSITSVCSVCISLYIRNMIVHSLNYGLLFTIHGKILVNHAGESMARKNLAKSKSVSDELK